MGETCNTCPFYVPTEHGEGECHFWPPMPESVHGGFTFPIVKGDTDWCAQHPAFPV